MAKKEKKVAPEELGDTAVGVEDTGEYDPHTEAPTKEPVVVKGKKLEELRMQDLGFKPTNRFEAVKLGEDAWRVFSPDGQPVTPVLSGNAKLSPDPLAPGEVLPAFGRAYAIAAAQNMHLSRALGSKRYNAIVDSAQKQGFPR